DRKKTMLVALPCNADQQCKLCSLRSGLASLRVSTGRELLCSDWRYRRSGKWEGKTMSRLRSLILLHRWAGRPGKLILISLSTFMFSFLFQLVWTVPGHAQHLPDQCLDPLPTPTPTPPSHRVVQLVNCTYVTLLGAANAAGQSDQELVSVLPREGTWVMG